MNRLFDRFLAAMLCLALIPAAGLSEVAPPSPTPAPSLAAPGHPQTQTVRVLLSRLNVANRMDLTLDGVYSVGNQGESAMIFERGSQLTVLLKNDSLYLYYGGMSWNAGANVYFTRFEAGANEENGVRLVENGNLYEGDLQLTANGDSIRPILHINVERYLLGVIAYEMGDEWPLEALKAQAVTARNYALSHIDPAKDYDVVDTTNDQVFKGHNPAHRRVEQAVAETAGVCGFVGDQIALCYYSASNGGQTELAGHAWPGADNGAYAMTDDPYDLENPASIVRSATLEKQPTKDVSYGFRSLLVAQLGGKLTEGGYDPSPESLRVDEISALSVDTPRYDAPSRLMTKLHITFAYSARKRLDVVPASVSTLAPENEVSLFAAVTPSPTPAQAAPSPDAQALPTPVPTPSPTPAPSYGPYEKQPEPVTLTLEVFPDVVSVLGMSMNTSPVEMVTVTETATAYTIEARRYGHGVGMSQRGAEWMALRYAMSYEQILAFYYPGMTLMRYPDSAENLTALDSERLSTPGPRPTATPRPTLMPVTQPAENGAWYAVVTEIADDSTLNLRSAPNTSGEILLKLYKNQRLLVVERSQEEGWVKVRTDAAEGYVMEKFLTKEE